MTFFGIDLVALVISAGYAGIFFMIFTEAAFLFGVIFPGSALLLVAGLLASEGFLDIKTLVIFTSIASLLGDTVGYVLGRKFGKSIFKKQDSRFLSPQNIERARVFYKKHGGKTVIFARFIHFARTLAPPLAGAGRMPYPKFLFYSAVGTIIWAMGVPFLAYRFGIAVSEQYVKYVALSLIIVLLLSIIFKYARSLSSENTQ